MHRANCPFQYYRAKSTRLPISLLSEMNEPKKEIRLRSCSALCSLDLAREPMSLITLSQIPNWDLLMVRHVVGGARLRYISLDQLPKQRIPIRCNHL